MVKGEKIRLDIHNILFSINKLNKTLSSPSISKIINRQKGEDLSFLYNVILNSMRLHLHCLRIISKFIKKRLRNQEKILLISAITQIVFLNIKEYGVINCSVEIAKKIKVHPGLINATLKQIAQNKKKLKETKISFNDLPDWLKNESADLTFEEKQKFINTFYKEPDIHIVFKNSKNLIMFDEGLVKTSNISGFLLNKRDIKNKKTFIRGDWWVQDFSSFFPLHNFKVGNKSNKFLDTCAAPGGKAFQLLSQNINVDLNDINKNRIEILKYNLNRLGLSAHIINEDFTNFSKKTKYDTIVVDAPCSAIGTIRKNPEILFKSKGPNFKELISLQEKMLQKASLLLNENGFIIYMTCSFLKIETIDQISKFMKKNNNFLVSSFKIDKENMNYNKLVRNNYMITLPENILNHTIDGYFAAILKKIK